MAFKDPKSTTEAGMETGVTKANLGIDKMLVAGFLAGAYIAFGALVAISVSSGLDPKTWGTLPTLFAGSVFALGLVLVVVAGGELLTGNMALVPLSALRRRTNLKLLGLNFTVVLIGNLIGSLFVAGSYYYLYGRPGEAEAERGAGDTERTGRFGGNGDRDLSERATTRTGA